MWHVRIRVRVRILLFGFPLSLRTQEMYFRMWRKEAYYITDAAISCPESSSCVDGFWFEWSGFFLWKAKRGERREKGGEGGWIKGCGTGREGYRIHGSIHYRASECLGLITSLHDIILHNWIVFIWNRFVSSLFLFCLIFCCFVVFFDWWVERRRWTARLI